MFHHTQHELLGALKFKVLRTHSARRRQQDGPERPQDRARRTRLPNQYLRYCGSALENFPKQAFDLLITDFRMPSMDGIELISHIRKLRPEIPIVLISGFADTLGLDEKSTGADL